jgi:hypothetical protein
MLSQSKERARFRLPGTSIGKMRFFINWGKSVGVDAQEKKFLGLLVNSKKLSFSLLPRKIDKIIEIFRKAWSAVAISSKDVKKI